MCGRFTREFTWKQVHDFLDVRFPAALGLPEMPPSYNVAPSQETPVCLVREGGARDLNAMRWGFRPLWATAGSQPPINARSETAASSPMFRDAMKRRRCLVPVSGFYEWRTDGKAKVPHYIRMLNDPIFCFAGVWEAGEEGSPATFAVLTTRPNELMKTIHDRMPVIVRREDYGTWMGGGEFPSSLLEPMAAEEMIAHRVGQRVGNPRNNDAELVRAVEADGLFG